MKHLFIARHGSYGDNRRINDYGREEMVELGQAIGGILGLSPRIVISSTAPRAEDSAVILAARLGLEDFERVPYLWTGKGAPDDSYDNDSEFDRLERLMELVDERRGRADGLVMVTHKEVVEEFPDYVLANESGQEGNVGEIAKGQAVHFDLEERTYQILP